MKKQVLSVILVICIMCMGITVPSLIKADDPVINPLLTSGGALLFEMEDYTWSGGNAGYLWGYTESNAVSGLAGDVYSGNGYIRMVTDGSTGAEVSYDVNVPFAGNYYLNIYSANVDAGPGRKCDSLYVNGDAERYVKTIADSGASWQTAKLCYHNGSDFVEYSDNKVALTAGKNTIYLVTNLWNGGYVYYDKIELVPETPFTAGQKVYVRIGNLPEVITLAEEELVMQLLEDYEDLTDGEKAKVTNYSVLEDALEAIEEAYNDFVQQPEIDGDKLTYEAEICKLVGSTSVVTSTSPISSFSGDGYVYLFDGSFVMYIDVPDAGKYQLFVTSANSDNGARCDYLSINGGADYLIATPETAINAWASSQPGTEFWDGSVLKPKAPEGGFDFIEGVNTIKISASWGYCAYDKIVLIPVEEETIEPPEILVQQPVKDGNRLIYETEICEVKGNTGIGNDSGNFPGFSGDGYVFLFTDSFVMNIHVPKAGKYQLLVSSANDANGGRCDYIEVNGGTKYLAATAASPNKTWMLSEPGTENWENGELKPTPIEGGFNFTAGTNTITISANWGYCAYDRIILVSLEDDDIDDEPVDKTAVDKINDFIKNLPLEITLKDADEILSVYAQYKALLAGDKALIINVEKLIIARARILMLQSDSKAPKNSLRYELEEGIMVGNTAAVLNETSVFSSSGGNGYVFLFDAEFSLDFYVPKAGYYYVYIVSGTTHADNGPGCDYVSINGGEKLLVGTAAGAVGKWVQSQPGTEFWDNDVLKPTPPANGFLLKEGLNTITISANWGYNAYDSIILVPTNNGEPGELVPVTADVNIFSEMAVAVLFTTSITAVTLYGKKRKIKGNA